jgi:cytochrome c oxidase cbb3-type subunit 3/ubiquinol-cytochrome c reductase cytochrome c subunit
MTMRRAYPLATIGLLAVVACKPTSKAAQPSSDASARDAAPVDGATTFASLCSQCHGADATGYKADNAPSLVSPTFLESATDEQLRRSIVDGRPGTSMAAYGTSRGGPLGPDAVGALVAWIRSHGPAPKPLPPRGGGDAGRGAPLYKTYCERCHGDAKTRGSAVQLANPRFLESASNPFLGWAIARGRPGTPMEAWAGKLTDAEIDDLVAYVRSLGRPPPAAALPPPTGKEPVVLNPRGKDPEWKLRDDRFVSVEQVERALADKRKMVIIDARPASDWMRVHITGAVSIPYHDLKRLDEVPADGTWVVAYCACPHHLSGEVVDALRKRGVPHSVVLDEGILEWQRRGYPIVAAPGVEPPPKDASAPPPR